MSASDAAQQIIELLSSVKGAVMRVGVVTVVSPLTLTLGGSTTAVLATGKNADFVPTVSDVVMCLQQGPVVFVVCQIG